jgi:hypothetical protein
MLFGARLAGDAGCGPSAYEHKRNSKAGEGQP